MYIRIIHQISTDIISYSFICISTHTSKQLNSRFCKCTLGSTANTTTYKYINTCFGQK